MNKSPLSGTAVADLFDSDSQDFLGSVEYSRQRAIALRQEIVRQHGEETANRIFDALGSPSASKKRRLDEMTLQTFFQIGRKQGWSDVETAQRFIAWNKKGPKASRLTKYVNSESAVIRKIARLEGVKKKAPLRKKRGHKPLK
jgi:hypothetical protein